MSCVPCGECGEGANTSIEDLDRWTDSLSNLLVSQEGRTRFKQYLENARMEEALQTLDFWEQCTRLMLKKPEGQDSPPHPSTSSSSSSLSDSKSLHGQQSFCQSDCVTESRRNDLKQFVDFGAEYVNFDRSELRELRKLLRVKTESEVTDVLQRTKIRTAELCKDEYELFRKKLLKEKRLLLRSYK